MKKCLLLLLYSVCFFTLGESLLDLPAEKWMPLSGNWFIKQDKLCEFSDSTASDNKPFWAVSGSPDMTNYRLETDIEVTDGVGSVYMAIYWQNDSNYYALKYSEPHTELSLLQVTDGFSYLLAKAKGRFKLKPNLPPVRLGFEAVDGCLTVYANGKQVIQTFSSRFSKGCVALGEAYRCVQFSNSKIIKLPASKRPRLSISNESTSRVFKAEASNADICLSIKNTGKTESEPCDLLVSLDQYMEQKYHIPPLQQNKQYVVSYKFEPKQLKAGEYLLTCKLSRNGKLFQKDAFRMIIAPPVNPYRFDVICWDSTGSVKEMKKLGFTAFCSHYFRGALFEKDADYIRQYCEKTKHYHDDAAESGLDLLVKVHSQINKGIPRKNKNCFKIGKHFLCPKQPEVKHFLSDFSTQIGTYLKPNSTIKYVLIDSEVENEERKLVVCTCPDCQVDMKKSGVSAAQSAFKTPWSMVGARMSNDPKQIGIKDGLIEDSNPYWQFLKWWWSGGNGLPGQRQQMVGNIKNNLQNAQFFHDPQLRRPPFANTAPGMDFISQWTYSNRSPLGFAENTDELLAAVGPGQTVCPNLQLFWYSNAVGPDLKSVNDRKKAKTEKNAVAEAIDAVSFGRFVTISPSHLKECIWLALSRPIDMIMLDGGSAISSLTGTYDFTNPDTPIALKEICDTLVKPYGPMLKELNKRPQKVAFLESAASWIFGKSGNYGNANRYTADCYNTALLAQLEPIVIYDNAVLDDRLQQFSVLILPKAKVILQSVYDKINEFISKGGIVIADNYLKAKIPGVIAFDFPQTDKMNAIQRQASWEKSAKSLQQLMKTKLGENDISVNANNVVIAQRSGGGNTKAFFVINDQREPGKYMGQFGKVLDQGVPQQVILTVSSTLQKNGYFYDVLKKQHLSFDNNSTELFLPAGEGRLLVWLKALIDKLDLKLSLQQKHGRSYITLKITALNPQNHIVKGVIPIKINIKDVTGLKSPFSGYYRLKDGRFTLELPVAINDDKGYWTITVEELLSGKSISKPFFVK